MDEKLSASEAVYGFVSWLTTRDTPVTFSCKHDAAIAADLIDEFCKRNQLDEPRENWTDRLVPPSPVGAES